MTYEELTVFASSISRLPKRELRCHPIVVMQLREETQWTSSHHTQLWRIYDLLACPVYEDPLMEMGAWEIHENGVVVAAGNTEIL